MSLVDSVRDAGIIGCGGAGFPTHVKVDSKVDIVIANGAECEPLLNTDVRVMEEYAAELIKGIRLIVKHVGADRGVIALKKKYKHAVAALATGLKRTPNIELFIVDNFYPAGDEQILLTEVTGRIVPEGGIPLMVGAVVSNVLTMVQIARADQGQVVTSRPVTLAGEVVKPQVLVAPIGTSVRELLDIALPTQPVDELGVIDGGPMMGRVVDLDAVVNKTSSGFLFLRKDHPVIANKSIPMEAIIRRSVAACCQCRLCTDSCSRYLQGHRIEPHLMMRGLSHSTEAPTQAMTAAFICSQCGLCEFACPMLLSPKRAYAELLKQFRAAGMKNPLTDKTKKVHEFRRYRKIGKDRMTKRYALAQFDRHDLPLSQMDDPATVRLSLTQSLGAPSEPVVKKGDKVKKGDLVARIPDKKLGSNLHASIDGTVTSVDKGFIVIERSRKR